MHDARPLVPTEAVRAKQEDALGRVGRTDQMQAALEHSEHVINGSGGEELHAHLARGIGRPFHPQGDRMTLADDGGHPGGELAVIEQMQRLHGDERLPRVGRLGVLGGEEIRAQHDHVQRDQQTGAEQGEAVAPEAPPDELPVRRHGDAVLGRPAGCGINGFYQCHAASSPRGCADRSAPAGRPTARCRRW